MPKSSRKHNARNTKSATAAFSPPIQQPTPLPEDDERQAAYLPPIATANDMDPDEGIGRLIDFDTPPPQPFFTLPPPVAHTSLEDNNNDNDNDESNHELDDEDASASMVNTYTVYRSPPFREAALPPEVDESPPPLPVLARVPYPQDDDEDFHGRPGQVYDGPGGSESYGRSNSFSRRPEQPSPGPLSPLPPTISPSFSAHSHSRSQSQSNSGSASPFTGRLDTLSRTIRGYVPSLPSAGPSPPLVSRPVSFGLFSNAGGPGGGGAVASTSSPHPHQHQRGASYSQSQSPGYTPQEYEREYERDEYYAYGGGYVGHQPQQQPPLPPSGYPRSSPMHGPAQSRVQVTHQPQPTQPPVDVHALSQGSSGMGSGSGLAQAMRRTGGGRGSSRSASAGGGNVRQEVHLSGSRSVAEKEREDVIVWARWDALGERKLLFNAYASHLQIWDYTDLGAISEVLNLPVAAFGTGSTGGVAGEERLVYAAVLSSPSRRALGGRRDPYAEERPILGVLLGSSEEYDVREDEQRTTFVLYSLRSHRVLKRLGLLGFPSTFVANEHFVVISTSTPSAIQILSSATLHTLHTIQSGALELYTPPPLPGPGSGALASPIQAPSMVNTAQSMANAISATAQSHLGLTRPGSSSSASALDGDHQHLTPRPQPVFALSGRLLAYAPPSSSSSTSLASPTKASRRLSSTSSASGPSPSIGPSSASSSPFGLNKLTNMTITQADVGQAALKVGESMFSGMKFLGGMALEAAKSRVAGGGSSGGPSSPSSISPSSRFVSRSAPDNAANDEDEAARRLREREKRRYSGAFTTPTPSQTLTVAPSSAKAAVLESGYGVMVVDLGSLLLLSSSPVSPSNSRLTVVDDFMASRSQPVAKLHFAQDGTSLGVALRDGHAMKVFKLSPVPGVLLNASMTVATSGEGTGLIGSSSGDVEVRRGLSVQTYDLRRGRTSAVVECLDWTEDGRWAGIGTRNRTVHLFAVNPYGGKADVGSHLEGRVRNVDAVEPRSVQLSPIARLRGFKNSPSAEHVKAPLTFTFIATSSLSSPASSSLLPPLSPVPVTHSPTLSPSHGKRGTNYQHVLVFDPDDGVLSLRRLTLEKHVARETSLTGGVAASVQALSTSISLPGMGGAGRLSSSPSNPPSSAGKDKDKDGKAVEPPMELGAKEFVVAKWDLKQRKEWVENRGKVGVEGGRVVPGVGLRRQESLAGDWLAEAELSTCSNSQRVLPRSLYLSHQFSFHTLGEDYHALIRSYQFDISGSKIEVRKEVEISAYSSGGDNDNFIEGFTAPRDIRRASSSFDEPIASAISGSFDNSNIPAILPMYPNGIPGSKPKSFRNSIPIRTMTGIGDGVTEGIGRIRREMHKVRSPQLVARSDSSMSGTVPLEFDEEDEDFLVRDALDVPSRHEESSTSRGTSRDGASAKSASSVATTPATGNSTHQLLEADVVGTVDEEIFDGGWDRQDKQAVEEAEQFHDFTAVGFHAVEQERQQQQHQAAVSHAPLLSGSKRKGRKRGN